MCYPEIPEIKEGMQLPSDYLSRTGYRLPSEAEWEYACRAETRTSRCYGQTEQLLGNYAWYRQTSQNHAWPVGSLKPNGYGLFDMHGNVMEWCQENYVSYSEVLGSVSDDREDRLTLRNSGRRVLRGGSYGQTPMTNRSAFRYANVPQTLANDTGFRLARTHR